MEKYRMSSFLEIKELDEKTKSKIKPQFRGNTFRISSPLITRDYLINDSIKYFLEKFDTPKSLDQVASELSEELNHSASELKKQSLHLFKLALKKGFLIPQDKEESRSSAQPMFKSNDLIGEYSILSAISNKKMVDIYKVCHLPSKETRVIKLLNSKKAINPENYQKELYFFRLEKDLLIKAKGITSTYELFDYREEETYAFMVLELIIGIGIPKFFRKSPPLSADQEMKLISNVLHGFSQLHEGEIIHGDIHPSNILVFEDFTVKIIDLGMSIDSGRSGNEIVKVGGVLYYLPPERINAISMDKFSQRPDFLSDVYQLGLIIYFILYRKVPFQGFIWEELSEQIQTKEMDFPVETAWGRPIPDMFKELILKCCAKNPSERYSTAKAVYHDFLTKTEAIQIS